MFCRGKIAIAALSIGILVCACPLVFSQVTHDVQMISITFSPADITIAAGDEVRWTNASSFVHTTTSGTSCTPDGLWDSSSMFPNDQFTVQFDTPGVYTYFCIPHCLCCAMTGTITVTGCTVVCPLEDNEVIASASTATKSPDLDQNGDVSIVDVSLFAAAYPPQGYNFCVDFDCDGVIGLVDLSVFAAHYAHSGTGPSVCQ